jgi:GAF domain-containing protein
VRARAFNKISRKIAAERPNVTYIDFKLGVRKESGWPFNSDIHAGWAAQIAGPIAAALNTEFASGSNRIGYQPDAEDERQAALERLDLLDTAPEERFDRIVRMAQSLLKTETATFALIDRDRVWFKSKVGVDLVEADRVSTLCNTTITERGGLEVGDASRDPRFADSPYVQGSPGIRFYAGYPVESIDGFPIGALCVFDPEPRRSTQNTIRRLRDLAILIQQELAR